MREMIYNFGIVSNLMSRYGVAIPTLRAGPGYCLASPAVEYFFAKIRCTALVPLQPTAAFPG